MSVKRRLLKCFKLNPKPLLGFKCTTPSASGSDTGFGEEFEENEEKQREFHDTDDPGLHQEPPCVITCLIYFSSQNCPLWQSQFVAIPRKCQSNEGGAHSHVPNGISIKPKPRVHKSRQPSPLREGTLLHPDTSHSWLLLSLQANRLKSRAARRKKSTEEKRLLLLIAVYLDIF